MVRNIFEGKEFLLFDIDNNPIALSKNCALKLNQSTTDVTTKDSQNWSENIVGIKDWSIEFEGLVSYDNDKFNTAYFLNQYQSNEPFFVQIGVLQTGFNHTFCGEVAIESIDLDAENGELVTYSGSLKGIGELEFTNSGTPVQSAYLKTETDPVFRGSASFNITETNKNDWFDAYNKSLTEVAFSTVGNKTTLNLKLRDGSVYSSFFNQIGGSGGSVDLGNYYNKTQSESLFQPIGSYVSSTYLSDYYYSKTQSDSKYLTSVDWAIVQNKPSFFDGQYSSLVNRPTSLSQFTNDLGNYGSWINKAQGDTYFQPLENQRLSKSNDVEFDKIKAVTQLILPLSGSSINGAIWIG